MHTFTRLSTTEMEVTSIRLERDLKEKLKEMSGSQGYQALIREVLWNYVRQKSGEALVINRKDIRAILEATAVQEELCALTGQIIAPNQSMLLGLTLTGNLVPLSLDSLNQDGNN